MILAVFSYIISSSTASGVTASCEYTDREKEIRKLISDLENPSKFRGYYRYTELTMDNLFKDYANFWGVQRIGADLLEPSDSEAYIGIMDNGFDLEHEGLKNRIHIHNQQPQHRNLLLHGTHVAGTIASLGPFSVAGRSNVKLGLFSYEKNETGNSKERKDQEALIDGGEFQKQLMEGISWLLKQENFSIINISLMFGRNTGWIEAIERYEKDKQVILVNAAGNDKIDLDHTYLKLLKHKNVIFVSNISPYGIINSNSNYGYIISLTAPGTDILSLDAETNNDFFSQDKFSPKRMTLETSSHEKVKLVAMTGTSMAAPHVTGTIGAMISHVEDISKAGGLEKLTLEMIQNYLKQTAVDIGPKGFDPFYGHGLVNAFGAVRFAELRSQMSEVETLERLTSESDSYLQKGVLAFEKALISKNVANVKIAGDHLRRSYHLIPNDIKRKKMLYLFYSVFGLPADEASIGMELFGQGCSNHLTDDIFKKPEVIKALTSLHYQILSQKGEKELDRLIGRYLFSKAEEDQRFLLAHLDSTEKVLALVDKIYELHEKDWVVYKLLDTLNLFFEQVSESPHKKIEYLPTFKNISARFISLMPGSNSIDVLETFEEKYGKDSGITFEKASILMMSGVKGAHSKSRSWISNRWPNDYLKFENLEEIGKMIEWIREMKERGDLNRILFNKIFSSIAGRAERLVAVTHNINNLWESLPNTKKINVLESNDSITLILLAYAGVSDANKWVSSVLGRDGEPYKKKEIVSILWRLPPNKKLDDLILPSLKQLVSQLESEEEGTRRELSEAVPLMFDYTGHLVEKKRVSEDEYIELMLESLPVIMKAHEKFNQRRSGIFSGHTDQGHILSKPACYYAYPFDANRQRNFIPAVHNIHKIIDRRSKYDGHNSNHLEARMLDTILNNLFVERYVKPAPPKWLLPDESILSLVTFILNETKKKNEITSTAYINMLIIHGLRNAQIKENIFNLLEKVNGQIFEVYADTPSKKEEHERQLSLHPDAYRFIRSPLIAAYALDSKRGEELIQYYGKKEGISHKDLVYIKLHAYYRFKQIEKSNKEYQGGLLPGMPELDLGQKIKRAIIDAYKALEEIDMKVRVISILSDYDLLLSEKSFRTLGADRVLISN